MLVLTRRLSQRIVFPAIDAAVQVLSIGPRTVRLGIEAPSSVQVLREELVDRDPPQPEAQPATSLRHFRHQVANRLNSLSLGLALVKRQLTAATPVPVRDTLLRMEHEAEALRQELELSRQSSALPAGRRALVVEDDKNERELLAGFLRLAGYQVALAGDGDEALAWLSEHGRPDVLLLDMMLPRRDGAQTLRAIREQAAYQGLTVFAISGH